MNRRLLAALSMAAFLLTACGGDVGSVNVTDERIGQPTGPNAALYFTVESSEDDRLLSATTEAAASIKIHETVMGGDGTMGMNPIDGLDVPANTEVVLEPGGLHLMLIDVDRLEVGDNVDVTLTWENAGEMSLKVEVVEPSDTMGDEGHEGHDG